MDKIDSAAALGESAAGSPRAFVDPSLSAAPDATIQSYPSLGGNLHSQTTLGTISDIKTGGQTKKVAAVIGSLVVLLLVIGGVSVGVFIWRSSKTTNSTTTSPPPSEPKPNPAPNAAPRPDMIKVEGGTFQMGRSDINVDSTSPYELNQYPAHRVKLPAFFIDRTEVTNAEYSAFVTEMKHSPPGYWTDGKPPAGQDEWPVTNVSLADAVAFARWRSKRDRVTYKLPLEEEWEYAARNGAQADLYPWGNEWRDNCANVNGNSLKPVSSYADCGSRAGVFDLIGNVWEWTLTKAAPYPGADQLRRQFKQEGQIIRGGSYREDFKGPDAITATRRSVVPPTAKEADIGFRLVRAAP
jgi:formylglycine-generating enzyme required for sulfatase activity